MTRRTKIVATIGPASESRETLSQLVAAGVDVARLNLSHGPVEANLERLARLRSVAAEVGAPLAVLADLPGPKIRAGAFPENGVSLLPGADVRLVPGDAPSTEHRITVDYDGLLDDLSPDDRVIIGDGAVTLSCIDVTPTHVAARVVSGAYVQGSPGVHLATAGLRLAAPTDEDLVLAEQLADAGVDYLGVSFVRRGADLDKVREVVGDRVRLVAKIETRSALDDMEAIVGAADAVMVARGDLGIDCPLEQVPHLQKTIIRYCVDWGVPVITATQMLESMVTAPAPTRAEVTDVANAVFDGTDAVMLSGETAIGQNPVEVVRTMARIAVQAESDARYDRWGERLADVQRGQRMALPERTAAAMAHAAWQAARDVDVAAILCCTRSGRTAREMARFRPECRLVGLSPDAVTRSALQLSWGVTPLEVELYETTDEMVDVAVDEAANAQVVKPGDLVVVLAGAPGGPAEWSTDVLRIIQVPG